MNLSELQSQTKIEILTDQETLNSHKRDASIFELVPLAVAFPKDASEISALVKYCSKNKSSSPELSITARAAGTDMSGGSIGEGIVLDTTKYLNHLLEIGGDFAIVEPGMYYRDFEKLTLEHNLLLPSYPASKDLCAMGGIVSNNSGGEKTLSYGKTKDYVESLEVVLSNGEIINTHKLSLKELEQKFALNNFEGELYRKTHELLESHYDAIQNSIPPVTKNSAGYLLWEAWDRKSFDLSKLFVGAQGTLGIISKIKLHLIHPTTHSRLLVLFVDDLSILGKLVDKVMEYKPETFESFDDKTFKLAVKFAPEMIKRMKGGFLKLAFQFLPEVWYVLTGGIPKLLLLAEFTGHSEEEAYSKLLKAKKVVEDKFDIQTHVTKSAEETQKYWVMRRESFNLLRKKVKNLHTAPFIDDVTVPVLALPKFLPELQKILNKYPSLVYTIAGHAGDANFHIIPLMDLAKESERSIIPKLSQEVYNLALSFHGSTTAEHNDGLVRGQYLRQMYGDEVFGVMQSIKKLFDPNDILNPHKKTEATWEYSYPKIQHF